MIKDQARAFLFSFRLHVTPVQEFEKLGWAENFLRKRTGTVSAIPDPRLKPSVLKRFGKYLGNVEANQKFVDSTFEIFEGGNVVAEQDEELATKDTASIDIENQE